MGRTEIAGKEARGGNRGLLGGPESPTTSHETPSCKRCLTSQVVEVEGRQLGPGKDQEHFGDCGSLTGKPLSFCPPWTSTD